MRHDRFSTVRYEVRKALGISVAEYCFCDIVFHLSASKKANISGYACAKNTFYAEQLGVTSRAIRKMKNRMIEADLIERHPVEAIAITTTLKWEEYHTEGGTKFLGGRNKVPGKAEQSSGPSNKDKNKDKNNKGDYTTEFENFWDRYGLKRGKRAAFKKWKKLTEKEKGLIDKTLNHYLAETTADRNAKSKKRFRKDPITYINQKVWEDYVERIQAEDSTELDQELQKLYDLYLDWLQKEIPEILELTLQLSKAQWAEFKQRKYCPNLYRIGKDTERRIFKMAHRKVLLSDAEYTSVWEAHCELMNKTQKELFTV